MERFFCRASKVTKQRFQISMGTTSAFVFLLALIAGCAATGEIARPDVKIFWPPPPLEPRIEYMYTVSSPYDLGITKTWFGKFLDSVFGREDIGERFVIPHGVFLGEKGRLLVTDTGNSSVHIFDTEKKDHKRFGEIGDDMFLVSPIGISEDHEGNIYVSDSALKKIFVFDRDGEYIFSFGDDLQRPTGLAIDADRKMIFVVDTVGSKVVVYDLKGKELYSFGKNGDQDGEFNYPTHIFLGQDGLVYISDTLNFRVQAFDINGQFQFKFGKAGDAWGDMSKPKGIAVDSEGHIYVVDSAFETVQIFRKDGKLLLNFGSSGTGPGNFNIPAGIYIDKKDNIIITDSYNRRIQVFRYLRGKERG